MLAPLPPLSLYMHFSAIPQFSLGEKAIVTVSSESVSCQFQHPTTSLTHIPGQNCTSYQYTPLPTAPKILIKYAHPLPSFPAFLALANTVSHTGQQIALFTQAPVVPAILIQITWFLYWFDCHSQISLLTSPPHCPPYLNLHQSGRSWARWKALIKGYPMVHVSSKCAQPIKMRPPQSTPLPQIFFSLYHLNQSFNFLLPTSTLILLIISYLMIYILSQTSDNSMSNCLVPRVQRSPFKRAYASFFTAWRSLASCKLSCRMGGFHNG